MVQEREIKEFTAVSQTKTIKSNFLVKDLDNKFSGRWEVGEVNPKSFSGMKPV